MQVSISGTPRSKAFVAVSVRVEDIRCMSRDGAELHDRCLEHHRSSPPQGIVASRISQVWKAVGRRHPFGQLWHAAGFQSFTSSSLIVLFVRFVHSHRLI